MKYEDVEEYIPRKEEIERGRQAVEDFYMSFRTDGKKKQPLFTDKCCIHCRMREPIGGY